MTYNTENPREVMIDYSIYGFTRKVAQWSLYLYDSIGMDTT